MAVLGVDGSQTAPKLALEKFQLPTGAEFQRCLQSLFFGKGSKRFEGKFYSRGKIKRNYAATLPVSFHAHN